MSDKDLGSRIKHYRKIKGFSQKELAEKIGVSNVVLSRYESSKRTPDADTQIKIADVLDISMDELYGRPSKSSNDHFSKAETIMFKDIEGFEDLPPEKQEAIRQTINEQIEFLVHKEKKDGE